MKRVVVILASLSLVLATLVILLVLTRPDATPSAPSAGNRRILYYRDPMNPAQTSQTPRKAPDGMDYAPVYADQAADSGSSEGEIRIDPSVIQNIGVVTEAVTKRDLSKVIRTVGRVDYDETRTYTITLKVSGFIDKLYINFAGQTVRRDEPLLEIYSPEVIATQAEYLVAFRDSTKLSGIAPPEEKERVRDLLASARRRLSLWDIPAHEIQELGVRGEPRRTVMLHSPVNGIVVEKMVFQGAAVESGMSLFRIADLSRVWVYAEVYEYELPWVTVGGEAEVELSYLPDHVFQGRVVYIDPSLSAQTRTARVRIELPNPEGQFVLRPNMFATVRLPSKPLRDVIAIPDQAVIRSGERSLVVVALEGGRFTSREVRLGVTADNLVQVFDGLQEGERIVTSSQFLIDSESNLRSAIQALAPQSTEPTAPASEPSSIPGGKQELEGMPGMSMPGELSDSTGTGHGH